MTLYVCSICKDTHHSSQPACPQVFTMKPLYETVTVKRQVTGVIADLVHFARSLANRDIKAMSDEELVNAANAYWDNQHGED